MFNRGRQRTRPPLSLRRDPVFKTGRRSDATALSSFRLPDLIAAKLEFHRTIAEDKGLEPSSQLSSGTALAVQRSKPISAYPPFARVVGLEPTPSVWKTVTLPLRHTRHSMWADRTCQHRFFWNKTKLSAHIFSYPGWDSNPHYRVSETRASFRLGYLGIWGFKVSGFKVSWLGTTPNSVTLKPEALKPLFRSHAGIRTPIPGFVVRHPSD